MFWDRIKDSIKKTEAKTSESKTPASQEGSGAGSEDQAKIEGNFDENLTSDVDEGLLEFRLQVAREKLEQKGVPSEELEEIFAKIRKDKSGECLKSLLAELD